MALLATHNQFQVEPGDVWRMGDHVLVCGDCRQMASWRAGVAALGGAPLAGIITSPPYAQQRRRAYGGVPAEQYVAWFQPVPALARQFLAADGSLFLNIKQHVSHGERTTYVYDLVSAIRNWNWRFVENYVWVHQGMPGRYGDRLKNQWEPIYHFALGRPCRTRFENVAHDSQAVPARTTNGVSRYAAVQGQLNPIADRQPGRALPGNVITIGIGRQRSGHPAAFPVALPAFFMRAFSDVGDIWCDPFAGSGTTALAANQHGRRALLIERQPDYCALALRRLVDAGIGSAERIS